MNSSLNATLPVEVISQFGHTDDVELINSSTGGFTSQSFAGSFYLRLRRELYPIALSSVDRF
jgi:hypothetical protein